MPFQKVGKNKYVGPSGRKFNEAQVKMYYANNESFPSHSSEKKKKGKK